jgi:hypothetical protein
VVTPADPGYDYYPLTAGRFSEFEADSIVFTEIPRDTIHHRYRIREVLSDTFAGADGKPLWRLQRFIKKPVDGVFHDSVPWLPKDVWLVDADKKRIQVSEENVRFTTLVFPPRTQASWNGNAANNKAEQLYVYTYVDEPEQIGAFHFEKVLKVTRKDLRTLISYHYSCEKYARGIGPVYKAYSELYSNQIVAGKPVESRIEYGVIFTQTLIAHGHE